MNDKRLLTVNEMATHLQVSSHTIYYWVSRSEIPFIKVGKHLRFNAEIVTSYFEQRTKELAPDAHLHN